MNYLSIPLQVTNKGFLREENLDKSIDEAISMLLQTPCQNCVTDPQYGFVFKNLRFEIFNETDGTVYNSMGDVSDKNQRLYKMKMSGSSKNINTFASELKEAIAKYEPRLSDVSTTMTYVREEKKIYVAVKGVIVETGKDYQYQTIIRIWN
jgi:phage baseplate assembly protein W